MEETKEQRLIRQKKNWAKQIKEIKKGVDLMYFRKVSRDSYYKDYKVVESVN